MAGLLTVCRGFVDLILVFEGEKFRPALRTCIISYTYLYTLHGLVLILGSY